MDVILCNFSNIYEVLNVFCINLKDAFLSGEETH